MTWTGQVFTVGQILTAAQMNNLQADITALANADSGAPGIVNGAFSSHPWSRADMNTATASTAGTVNDVDKISITLNAYSFFPMIHAQQVSDQLAPVITGHSTDGANPDSPRFAIVNNTGISRTYDVDHRYIAP